MLKKLLWFCRTDRIGPDIPTTHPLLYFKRSMRWLCRRKFKAFGEGSEFRPHCYAVCTRNIIIGDDVTIHPGTMLFATNEDQGYILIEDHVGIGSGVHVYVSTHRHDIPGVPVKQQGHYPPEPVVIRSGAWLGARVTILPGVEIGQGAVVGAGAVVIKDVPPRSVVMGNPARVLLSRDDQSV